MLHFRVFGGLAGSMFRLFLDQNRHLDAMRGPVGSDIQKYRIFPGIIVMDMRIYRIFSSFRGLGDEMILLLGALFGAILETFSLPKRMQKSALLLR